MKWLTRLIWKVWRTWTPEDVAAEARTQVTAVDYVRSRVYYDGNGNADLSDDCMEFSAKCKEVFDLKGWDGFVVRVQSTRPVSVYIDKHGARHSTYIGHRFWCWEDNGLVWFSDQRSTNVAGTIEEIPLKCKVGYDVVIKEVLR